MKQECPKLTPEDGAKMYFSAMPYDYDDIALLEVCDESGNFQRENNI